MDTHVDEKIYRQIEKNLNHNINQNLFANGRELDVEQNLKTTVTAMNAGMLTDNKAAIDDNYAYPNVDVDHSYPTVSRAEYIKQAREACLRQLSTMQNSRQLELYQAEAVEEHVESKKKPMGLLHEKEKEEDTVYELASFRSLLIRTVCAIVIFASVFLVDKLKISFGGFSYEIVREYVIGNNQLEKLESFLVSFLK